MSYAPTIAVVVLALALLVALYGWSRRVWSPPPAPVQPPASRSEVARRVGELEADVAALRRQLTELEGSTGNQFKRVWGALSVARRTDRQSAGDAGQLDLSPVSEEDGVRPLTPDLAARLQAMGQATVAPQDQAPAMPPRLPPRTTRRW